MSSPSAAPPETDPPRAGAVLFRSANLLVRKTGAGERGSCVVTFACLLDVPGVGIPGFGEAFFRDRGVDAVHVTCAGNDWYQYPELPAALDVIRSAVRPYARVLAYGSSMGGYAAVRFGGRAGAHEALAISPQFSVDARRVPFERRWRAARAGLRFLHEDEPISVPVATVVYDPRHVDRRHVDLLAAAVPLTRIPLIHAGHPAGAYLAEAGLLQDLVLDLVAGRAPPDVARRLRAARRTSGQYLFTLSRRLPARRARAKLSLARLAVAAVPGDSTYSSYLGLLLDGAGDVVGAGAAHRRAAALSPADPTAVGRLARFLFRRGRVAEAAEVAATGIAAAPADRRLRHLAALIHLRAGEIATAVRGVLAGPERAALLLAVSRDWLRTASWRPDREGWRRRGTGRRVDRLRLDLGASDTVESTCLRRDG